MKHSTTEFNIYLKTLRIHPNALATVLGVNEQTIYNYIVERTKPKSFVFDILTFYDDAITQCAIELADKAMVTMSYQYHDNFHESYPSLAPLNDEVQLEVMSRARAINKYRKTT